METTSNKPIGPMMGLIIILLIIVASGIYFWFSRSNTKIIDNIPNNNTETTHSLNQTESQDSSKIATTTDDNLNGNVKTETNNIQ